MRKSKTKTAAYNREYYKRHKARLIAYSIRWRSENPERARDTVNKRLTERASLWKAFIGSIACSQCGKTRGRICFHHTGQKEFNVSDFIWHRPFNKANKQKLRIELQACVILCAPCHNTLHKKRGKEYA